LNNDALWAAVHLRIEDKSSFTALYRAVREADLWARLQLGAAGEGHIPQAARGQLRGALFARLADVNELPGGVILGDCVHTFAAVLRLLELEAEHLTGLLRRADPPVTIGDRAAAAPRQTVPAQEKRLRKFRDLKNAGAWRSDLGDVDAAVLAASAVDDGRERLSRRSAGVLVRGEWGADSAGAAANAGAASGFLLKEWADVATDNPEANVYIRLAVLWSRLGASVSAIVPEADVPDALAWLARVRREVLDAGMLAGKSARDLLQLVQDHVLPPLLVDLLRRDAVDGSGGEGEEDAASIRTDEQGSVFADAAKQLEAPWRPSAASVWRAASPPDKLQSILKTRLNVKLGDRGTPSGAERSTADVLWAWASAMAAQLPLPQTWRQTVKEAGLCPVHALVPGLCMRGEACHLRHTEWGALSAGVRALRDAARPTTRLAVEAAHKAAVGKAATRGGAAAEDPPAAYPKGGKGGKKA